MVKFVIKKWYPEILRLKKKYSQMNLLWYSLTWTHKTQETIKRTVNFIKSNNVWWIVVSHLWEKPSVFHLNVGRSTLLTRCCPVWFIFYFWKWNPDRNERDLRQLKPWKNKGRIRRTYFQKVNTALTYRKFLRGDGKDQRGLKWREIY